MKKVFLNYNSETKEFEAEISSGEFITSKFIGLKNQDIAYYRFMTKLYNEFPNNEYLYQCSSSIDHFVFDHKNYEWSNEEFIINTKQLIQKNNKFIRKSDKGQLVFTRDEDGRLNLAPEEEVLRF